ncbi:MAG: GNAT family N-acetyltransferase [Acidobacteria bacterium]|jgi:ribosomal-protein-alanine N-acetyltransferase|nr:GNAT family N-acetyltransferase [Acidobacteriota bacterium]
MLETERLIMRPFIESDVDEIFAMRSDEDIMRFIREPQGRKESFDWIKLVSAHWNTDKLGFCAVIEKNANKFLGWCGIWRLKETGEMEIGYAIDKAYWGKGFATEAAEKFMRYAFEQLNAEKLVAVARPENTASRRVMEKLGMKFVKTGTFYSQTLVQYSISKSEWEKRRQHQF